MNKEELKKWVDKYNSDISEGKFTCFFCENKYSAKEDLGFLKTIKSQNILGCSVCIKGSGAKALEKIQELGL